jgi:hypothetical protein
VDVYYPLSMSLSISNYQNLQITHPGSDVRAVLLSAKFAVAFPAGLVGAHASPFADLPLPACFRPWWR